MMIKKMSFIFIAAFILFTMEKFAFAESIDRCSVSCFPPKGSNVIDPTKAVISLTGRAVMCVRNTLNVMFDDTCEKQNILKHLKAQLKNMVYAALTLFIVLLGLKIATSGSIPKKSEFFSAILKFGFVIYFTIGTGLNDIVYTGGMAAMSSLSNFLMPASSAESFCSFNPSTYEKGYDYLAMWDAIDCRISQYLFIGIATPIGLTTASTVGGALTFGVLAIIIPLIFSLQIVFAFFLIIFAIFIISIAASILHFFILAMISLALMTYLGVIFVPMILFSFTKKFFDSWWKITLSFAIQPVVMTAFIAFPFLVFDNIMYDDCNFTQNQITKVWTVTESSSSCQDSLGYKLDDMFRTKDGPSKILTTISSFFYDYTAYVTYGNNFVDLFSALLRGLFFCYLFMKFAEYGGKLAAKLTGGPEIGEFAMGMGKIFNAAIDKLKKKPEPKKDGGKEGVSASSKTSREGIDVSSKK